MRDLNLAPLDHGKRDFHCRFQQFRLKKIESVKTAYQVFGDTYSDR